MFKKAKTVKLHDRFTQYEIRSLIGLLEGYELNDSDRFNLMEKLGEVDEIFESKENRWRINK